MSATIHRRPLTELLLTTLATVLQKPVGDGTIPAASGWTGTGPNDPTAKFRPYVVLTATTATPAPGTGDFVSPQANWHMPYLIQSFGANREQTEWMGDKARSALASLSKTVIDLVDAHYKVQQVWTGSIGGNSRVPQTDPPYWSQADTVTLWLARR